MFLFITRQLSLYYLSEPQWPSGSNPVEVIKNSTSNVSKMFQMKIDQSVRTIG